MQTQRPKRRNKSAKQQLQFDALSQRTMLAGISFDPGTGVVLVDGSNGADSILVSQSITQITVTFANIQAQSFPTANVSKILFHGRNGGDWFRNDSTARLEAYGQAGDDTLIGGSADDILRGGDGADRMYGNGGSDRVTGDAGDDFSFGGAMNDRLESGTGNDRVNGDDGNDFILAGNGDDYVDAGGGDDQVFASFGMDLIFGGAGNDLLVGNEDSDNLNGQDGIDELYGNDGDDRLSGGNSDDRLVGGNGLDNLLGDGGIDALYGQADADWLSGGLADDSISGSSGDDRVVGGGGADDIWGGDGQDSLDGDDGNDWIVGGLGDDSLSGGGQDDTLLGDVGNDSLSGGSGSDSCHGGNGIDDVWGDDGDDDLNGGGGNDDLSGGAGADKLSGGSGNDDYDSDISDDLFDSSEDYSSDGDFEIRGLISNLDPANQTLTINGIAVNYAGAEVKGTLANGAFYKAEGSFQNGILSAHEVEPEDPNDQHDQFEAIGAISNLNPAAQTFSFLGLTVNYSGAEVKVSLANDAVVKVEGSLNNSIVTAREIESITGDDQQSGESNLELRGNIANLDTANHTFTVLGITVDYSSAQVTATIAQGALVKVDGNYQNGVLTAREVQAELPDDNDENVEAVGQISNLDTGARTFSLLGFTVDYSQSEVINPLADGTTVRVEGWFDSGAITAEKIR